MSKPEKVLDCDALDQAQAITQQIRALINAASACLNGPGDGADAATLLELAHDRSNDLDRRLDLVSRSPAPMAEEPEEGLTVDRFIAALDGMTEDEKRRIGDAIAAPPLVDRMPSSPRAKNAARPRTFGDEGFAGIGFAGDDE